MFEIKITASTAIELGEKITALMAQFGSVIPDAPATAPADDKPKRTRAKAEAPAADAAPAASKLEPADEGNDTAAAGTAAASDTGGTSPDAGSTSSTSTTVTTPASLSDEKPAGPTRDDAMSAAVKFSSPTTPGGGTDALEAVLKEFGVEKFSALTEAQYGDFIAAMDKKSAAASNALS